MNDLIDENEFIRRYNPWKRFGLFYLLAAIHLFIFYQMVIFTEIALYVNRYVLEGFAVISIVSPLLLGLVMLLGNTMVATQTLFTKILAVFLLGLLYYCGLIMITIFETIKNTNIERPSAAVFGYLGLYSSVCLILTLVIALPVLRLRKKRLSRDTDNLV